MATDGRSSYAFTMGWRGMTAEEAATLPAARLGGALLWMVLAALLLCSVAIAGIAFAPERLDELGGRYTIAVGFVTLWSAAFTVMTLLRLGATPMVASAGLVVWIAYRLAVAVFGHAGWPLAVDLLGEIVLAAGFCGYMAGGVRPNAYYRRRLPTP
jgi:hypothetical protein